MPRGPLMSSGSSSPIPPQDDDEQAEREHQQEVDLHLATSMSRGADLMTSRSRSRSGGSEIAGRNQTEQDVRFFEGSASPPGRNNVNALSQRSPASPNAAAAARFYRQNKRRTLSDTSVDSQPGLIDHRGSQASMPFPFRKFDNRQGSSPRSQNKPAVSRKRSSRLRSEVQTDDRSTALERGSSNEEDGSPEEDGIMNDAGDRQIPRRRQNTLASNLSVQRQARDAEYAAGLTNADNDNAESAVIVDVDEDEEPVTDYRGDIRRGLLNRHNSIRSQRSQVSGRLGSRAAALRADEDDDMTFTPSLSRRPSDAAKVEEDVCYPMLEMREADMEEREGGGPHTRTDGRGSPREDEHHRSHYHEKDYHEKDYHDKGHHSGLPGVLPNFPFPFDFGALEEFCGDERRSNGIPIPRSRDTYTHGRTAPGSKALSFSPEQEPSVMRRRNGELPGRRQRKLSESTGHGVGRYQRKLALFEGNSNGGSEGLKFLSPPATSKTPLLSDGGKMSTGFGTVESGARPMTASNEKARPYRFSFYSNALPSTIHARSLAEIPAEGQSFEELFVGRRPETPPEEWDASVPETMANGFDAMLPARQPGVDSSGKNTPDVSALGHANSDGKFAGRSNTASRTGLNAFSTKPRTNIMRSNEDAEANTWWLDVLNPTDAEMKVLGKVFGIHPLTIEDILMEETREKIELFRNYYLVCFRSFDQDPYSPTYLEPLNMYIIVMREGTLSFHFRGTPHPQNVRRRIKQLKDFINVTSDWISYALIDDITDAFGPLIQNIEYEVDSIDELVLILKDAEQSDMLRRIGTCRKKVMGLLRLMGNKADVVKGLAKRCNENWSVAPKSDIGLYLSDIQDHLITMTQNLNHYEKILSRSHSNYLAQISIEMTDANNQINDVLSKLTALGTVLIPMNLVTGLWGMNVNVPGQDVDNLNWFFSIVGCLLAFALLGGWLTWRTFRK